MTTEKLQQANELQARIEKAKEIKALIDQEGAVSIVNSEKRVELNDPNLLESLADALDSHIEKLEYDFKWL